MTGADGDPAEKPRAPLWRRLAPVAVLAALAGLVFVLGLDDRLTFESLRENRALLLDWVAEYGVAAAAAYVAIYAAVVALSLPGAVFMTLAGGFLFGAAAGTACTVAAATLGATAIFLVARTAVGDSLRARAGPWMARLEAGFRGNALSYLLVLRLIPLFPFWLVNLVPAMLGVPLRVFVLGTAVGIVPGTFVFSLAGAGLGGVFDSGEEFSVGAVLTTETLAALAGLALLALAPVLYKRAKARRADSG